MGTRGGRARIAGCCRSANVDRARGKAWPFNPFSTHPVRRCHQTPSTQRSMNSSGRRLPTEESGNGVDKLCPPKEASDRRSSPAPHGTARAQSGLQIHSQRSTSGSSALDQSKVGQSWGNSLPVRHTPTTAQEQQRSPEHGDRPAPSHQDKTNRKAALGLGRAAPSSSASATLITSAPVNHCSRSASSDFCNKIGPLQPRQASAVVSAMRGLSAALALCRRGGSRPDSEVEPWHCCSAQRDSFLKECGRLWPCGRTEGDGI